MPIERKGLLEVGGYPVTIIGRDVQVGQDAPEFAATTLDWKPFSGIRDTHGKVRIIASMPSLETPTCEFETRRFNQEAANLSDDIIIMVISADLPYTQKRWCGANGIDQVLVLSDHHDVSFGEAYGTLIKERRILRRAVFVADREGKIVYVEYTPSLGVEPDYEQVLAAAKFAVAS